MCKLAHNIAHLLLQDNWTRVSIPFSVLCSAKLKNSARPKFMNMHQNIKLELLLAFGSWGQLQLE